MLFSTLEFWLFLAVIYGLALGLAQFDKSRPMLKSLVMVASLAFYAFGDAADLWVLVWIIALCFFSGELLARSPGRKTRRHRVILFLSITLAIGTLIYFKYLKQDPADGYVMPLGISFFTFQALSYVIDIYRGRATKADSLHDFVAYIAFFPQLIAGPIERFGHLYPQIKAMRVCSLAELKAPVFLISLALFKKIFVANSIGPTVQLIFHSPDSRALEFALGGWAMAMQVYFDFSAYSDFAVGLGLLFGVKITQNFRPIWFATNPLAFWDRWNVTTGRWFRDYVLVPLGGNGKNRWQAAGNMIIMFIAIGLWHGASWNWIAWGLFQGLIVAGYRDIKAHTEWAKATPAILGTLFLQLFLLPVSGLLHAASTEEIWGRIKDATIGGVFPIFDMTGITVLLPHLMFFILPAVVIDVFQEKTDIEQLDWRHIFALAGVLLGFAAFLQKGVSQSSFIYFAF